MIAIQRVLRAGLLAAIVAGCTNDYGGLDFSGGLGPASEGGTSTGGRSGTGGESATGGGGTGGTGGNDGGGQTGGSPASGGAGGIVVDGSSDRDGSADASDGTLPDASIDGSTGGAGGRADAATGGTGGITGGDGGGAGGAGGDGAAPDASPDSGPLGCNARYGSATGYVLCAEEPAQCTIAVTTSGTSCNAVCTAFGGVCLDANDNNAAAPCTITNAADTCSTPRNETICTCTRP